MQDPSHETIVFYSVVLVSYKYLNRLTIVRRLLTFQVQGNQRTPQSFQPSSLPFTCHKLQKIQIQSQFALMAKALFKKA